MVEISRAVREIADSSRALPAEIDDILRLRRDSPHVSPLAWWLVDGRGRQFVYALAANRQEVLVLSRGPGGEIGGADDLFVTIPLERPSRRSLE